MSIFMDLDHKFHTLREISFPDVIFDTHRTSKLKAGIENILVQPNPDFKTLCLGIHPGLQPLLMKTIQRCKGILEIYHKVHKETRHIMLLYLLTNKLTTISCCED